MQFLIIGRDGTDNKATERRLAMRPAHIELGEKLRQSGNMWYGAALWNDNNQMIGSILLMNFPSEKELTNGLTTSPTSPAKSGRSWRYKSAMSVTRGNSTGKKNGLRDGKEGNKNMSKKWSGEVTKHSNALDLETGVFAWQDAGRIAASLKRSAEASKRRKGTVYQSAMSMLNFYINRAGKNLPESQKQILEQAKAELRKLFGKS